MEAPLAQKDIDQLYLYAAHSLKGIKPLLRSFFGFLERNTDFYEASPEACQHMVLAVFQEFCQLHHAKGKEMKYGTIPNTQGATIEEIGSLTEEDNENEGKTNQSTKDSNISEPENTTPKDQTNANKQETKANEEEEEDEDVGFEESKRTKKGSVHPNEGDGATFKNFKWTQAPTELEILLPLCKHRRSQVSHYQDTLLKLYSFANLLSHL